MNGRMRSNMGQLQRRRSELRQLSRSQWSFQWSQSLFFGLDPRVFPSNPPEIRDTSWVSMCGLWAGDIRASPSSASCPPLLHVSSDPQTPAVFPIG